ncbi:MAG TPA: anhydro-N-acetylmuramic acid kinase, partial [Longimicrobiales bacterium]|nr:anhydro-N-acetylmuramic acid kinase [Longimicrobiales bacterium]
MKNFIGLMSGTSLDGIDAAVVEFNDDGSKWNVLAFVTSEMTHAQREQVHDAIVHGNTAALCQVHADLGEWLARAAMEACKKAGLKAEDVTAIGSHGQTVWHVPPAGNKRGSTLQLGDPATIAERTGIAVVSDFRTRDMAAGGEGAPLVPFVDRFLFAHPEKRRILQNIGGVGNLSWVARRGEKAALVAFDTGPGNTLMNSAVELATDNKEHFDRDGVRGARGKIN